MDDDVASELTVDEVLVDEVAVGDDLVNQLLVGEAADDVVYQGLVGEGAVGDNVVDQGLVGGPVEYDIVDQWLAGEGAIGEVAVGDGEVIDAVEDTNDEPTIVSKRRHFHSLEVKIQNLEKYAQLVMLHIVIINYLLIYFKSCNSLEIFPIAIQLTKKTNFRKMSTLKSQFKSWQVKHPLQSKSSAILNSVCF